MRDRVRSSKLVLLSVVLILGTVYLLSERRAVAYSSGPDPSRTGAPGELTCSNGVSCHTGSNNLFSNSTSITVDGLPANYTLGQEYTVTINADHQITPARQRYGFQATVLDNTGKFAGEMIVTNASRTQITDGFGQFSDRKYIQHTESGTSLVSGKGQWSFKWKAPSTSAGRVTFYIAVNAANGGAASGDFIHTKSLAVDAPQTTLSAVTVTATNYSAAAITPESIVSVFGSKLTTLNQVFQATDADPNTPGIQLPTTLGGTTIKVRDSQNNERFAPIFAASQGQINYLIPALTATGTATITITTDDNTISTGTINVVTASPTIFTANASGSGLPAGYVVRVRNGQLLPDETIGSCSTATGSLVCTTTAVSLGPNTDAVALVLFGTGFRAAAQGSVSATIGGTAADVIGAGAQGGFVGLDQANLLVPRSVTKDVDVDVILSVGATPSNAVKVKFTN